MSINPDLSSELNLGYLRANSVDYSSQNFVNDNGSPVEEQQLAFAVPLGSQLSLLDAQLKGNEYLQFAARANPKLSAQERSTFMNLGYNDLAARNGSGYFSFGSAYGR
jgi:hypothetical protein